MKAHLPVRVRIEFGIALAIFLATGLISYRGMQKSLEDGRLVAHTHEVISELSMPRILLLDAQRAARAYALTGESRFLEPFHQAVAAINKELQDIRSLTVADPEQQRRLDSLQPLTARQLHHLDNVVATRQSGGIEAAARFVGLGEGERGTEQIADALAAMEQRERDLLRIREQEAQSSAGRALLLIALGTVLALGVILAASRAFRRDVAARLRAEESLARLSRETEMILSAAGDGIYRVDLDGNITYLNPAAVRLLGCSLQEAAGRNSHDLFHHSHADGAPFPVEECPIYAAFREGAVRHVPADVFWRKDGSSFDVEYISAPILVDGEAVGSVITFRDISERRQTELALQDANEKLSAWVHELHRRTSEITQLGELGELLHTCVSAAEAYPIVARACEKLFPHESGALCVLAASRNLVDAVAVWGPSVPGERVFSPDQCWALRRGRIHLIEGPKAGPVCAHVTGPPAGGSICVPMMAQSEAMGILHLQSAATADGWSDARQKLAVTIADHVGLALANIQLRESLRIQSIRDPLTGLFNRRYMEESLERELRRAARQHRPLGIIMLDVDHFKRFNDTFGHEAGDTLLREIGQFLQSRTRGEDIACRYGGEEFTLILPDATQEITRQRAEQIRNEFRHLNLQHRGQPLGVVTVSLGVSIYPRHGMESADLLRSADRALYQAKAQGRDCVRMAVIASA